LQHGVCDGAIEKTLYRVIYGILDRDQIVTFSYENGVKVFDDKHIEVMRTLIVSAGENLKDHDLELCTCYFASSGAFKELLCSKVPFDIIQLCFDKLHLVTLEPSETILNILNSHSSLVVQENCGEAIRYILNNKNQTLIDDKVKQKLEQLLPNYSSHVNADNDHDIRSETCMSFS
jgi:hypothetical protein